MDEATDGERRAAATSRIDAIRAAADIERSEHRQAMIMEAERSSAELQAAMESLTKGEQRLVRLHAAVLCEEPGRIDGHGPQRQMQYDAMARRLARYMATGEV